MIGDFYGDGNRYRGVTSCDPENESYTIIGGDMNTNIAELKKLRNEIGSIPVMADEDGTDDNVAIALAIYFTSLAECPDDDVNRETGWSQWAMNRTNNVLDRIAGIFIKKHAALLGEYAQSVTIEEAIIRNGNGYVELGHPMFKAFLTSIAEVFDSAQEAENYIEFGVHGDRGDFYITIQKAEGKSPGQVNSELKAENADLKKAVEFWEDQAASFEVQLEDANKHIAELEAENKKLKEKVEFYEEYGKTSLEIVKQLEVENSTLKEQLKQKDTCIEMQQADIAELSNEVQRLREMIMDLERDNAELKACKTQRNVFG